MRLFSIIITIASLLLPNAVMAKESAFERVVRTNILRCGFASVGTHIQKDPETGKVEGFVPDIARELGKTLGVKVEWTAEVGYADFADGLKSRRYDAFCGILAMVPARGRVAMFTIPTFYQPYYAYIRDEEKTAKSIEDFNRPDIKAGSIDGEAFQMATRKYLPKAEEFALPNMSLPAQLYQDLAQKKTDIIIHDPIIGMRYIKDNPGRVKLGLAKPVDIYPIGFAVAPDEQTLLNFLNLGLGVMQTHGRIDSILSRYGIDDKTLYRATSPYKPPSF